MHFKKQWRDITVIFVIYKNVNKDGIQWLN